MPRSSERYSEPAPSPAWTAFALLVCLAFCAAGIVGLLAPEIRHAFDALAHRKVLGLLWIAGALFIGLQLVWTTRKGYVYWHHTQTVAKTSHPRLYRMWCVVQLLLVVMATLIGILFL